ncbi:MAG: hypothetical protein M1355_03955 [Patescibacteria group bacterium]|nr:hypothetical protein [Patescibacteria group bacterium]
MQKRPLLSWKLNDYLKNEIDPPEILIKNPAETEGELMSEDEIKIWFSDNVSTLLTLKGVDDKLYKELLELLELLELFRTNLHYLEKIGLIEKEIIKDFEKTL